MKGVKVKDFGRGWGEYKAQELRRKIKGADSAEGKMMVKLKCVRGEIKDYEG